MLNSGLFSSKTDDWATPQSFFDEMDKEFHFTLDVCADTLNHKCKRYFTKDDDGLSMDWGGGYYMVQSAVWPRNWQMGSEMLRAYEYSSHATAGKNGHKMVSRLYLSQGRNQIYQGKAQIWKWQESCAFSEYGGHI